MDNQTLNEQVSRIKGMMKSIINEDFDGMSDNIEPYSKFESPEQLIKSITDRLITAVQLQEWSLVEEVTTDLISFVKNNTPEEEEPRYKLPGYDETMASLDKLSIR